MSLKTLRQPEYKFGSLPSERTIEELLENSIVPIDKPPGPSSHEVSSIVRKMLSSRKTGHSGTLDPNVSGVLPVLLGDATKLAKVMLASRKEYVCVMRTKEPLGKADVESAFENQRGEIYQTPPLQSAVRKALRTRKVYDLEVTEVDGNNVLFRARVQAGTYIRTICRDFGLISGVESEMADLRRTMAAGIPESKAVTLQELSDRYWLWKAHGNGRLLRECLLPPESVVKPRRVVVDDNAIHYLCSGCDGIIDNVTQYDENIGVGGAIGVYSGKGELLCIAKALVPASEFESHDGSLFAVKRVVMPQSRLASAPRLAKKA